MCVATVKAVARPADRSRLDVCGQWSVASVAIIASLGCGKHSSQSGVVANDKEAGSMTRPSSESGQPGDANSAVPGRDSSGTQTGGQSPAGALTATLAVKAFSLASREWPLEIGFRNEQDHDVCVPSPPVSGFSLRGVGHTFHQGARFEAKDCKTLAHGQSRDERWSLRSYLDSNVPKPGDYELTIYLTFDKQVHSSQPVRFKVTP